MICDAAFIYSEDFSSYKFADDHPFNQLRVKMTKELLELSNRLHETQIVQPRLATEDELLLVHDQTYIDAVKLASEGMLSEDTALSFGLGTEDTPIFPDMHKAASLLVGATLTAVDQVMEGHVTHALNLGGGLHHGFPQKASGFCIYNDGAIAIKYIREKYNLRVLYIDTDAHHGDGVQWAFYDDPNVCTLSIHETGRYLYPGTGNVNERGLKEGYGYSFNIPVDAFTEDESFIHIYTSAITEITEYFHPDIIVSQNGADAHCLDPLTHLSTTMKTYETVPMLAHELAHQYCNGKWIALGGGGYDIWRVVPRAWGQIWNIMTTDSILQGTLPSQWIDRWQSRSPVSLPNKWNDKVDIYKPIPRKAEITEKNKLTLEKALQLARNKKQYNKK